MRETPNAPRRTAVIECALNSSAVADSQLCRSWFDGRHGPGERHHQKFALLKIVDGLAKLLPDVFRERTDGGPRCRMEDRRLHPFNVSYLGHSVKAKRRGKRVTAICRFLFSGGWAGLGRQDVSFCSAFAPTICA